MSFKIAFAAEFERELKRLIKKHVSLKSDFAALIAVLQNEPQTGTPLGNNCYKIRLSIASKNKGKSGGARVITYLRFENEVIYLLSIYDKSDEDNISDKEIINRISRL